MKFETYLLLLAIIYGVFRTQYRVQRSRSPQERTFAIRASIFTWMVFILMFAVFAFLPTKFRLIMLIPGFITVASLMRMWANARARLRRESAEQVDLERMKRVNSVREN